jgi:hypothetical protein
MPDVCGVPLILGIGHVFFAPSFVPSRLYHVLPAAEAVVRLDATFEPFHGVVGDFDGFTVGILVRVFVPPLFNFKMYCTVKLLLSQIVLGLYDPNFS